MSTTNLSEELLSKISFLDAFSGSNGVLSTKGREMVANPSDQTIIDCLMTITDIKKKYSIKFRGSFDSKICL